MKALATHRFSLAETMDAYDVFAAAAETNALKVVLEGTNTKQLIAAGDRPAVAVQAK